MKKIFIVHTITASQGGDVIGVYPTFKRAKGALLDAIPTDGWDGVDYGHFIRIGELGVAFSNVLALPRAEEE
jgi:hypothetical protein